MTNDERTPDMSNSDLPAGYRWADEHEMNRKDAIVVKRTADVNGVPYTQDEADLAVPMDTSHAVHVRKVYTLMGDLGVSLYDLELMGHIDDQGENLLRTPEETFDALILVDDFDIVGDSHAIENYHAATAEYVESALIEHGLLSDPDDETCTHPMEDRVVENDKVICKMCDEEVDDEDDGWINPEATGDDTFEARHEPVCEHPEDRQFINDRQQFECGICHEELGR